MAARPSTNNKINTTINNEIQIGDNTHTHDQAILPVNFKTINTIVSSPVNPIPPELEVVLLIYLTFPAIADDWTF